MIANPFRDTCRRHATIRRNTPANGTGGTRTAPLRPPRAAPATATPTPIGRRSFRRRGAALSKTRRKAEMHDLQSLGEALVRLSAARLAELGLPERLADAIEQARAISKHEARRRQMQYIGTADARRRPGADPCPARAMGRGARRRKGAPGRSRALARAAARGRRRARRAVRRRSACRPRTRSAALVARVQGERAQRRAAARVSRAFSRAERVAGRGARAVMPGARRAAAGSRR